MKKFIACLFLSLAISFSTISVYADNYPSVSVNDLPVQYSINPELVNGRLLAPLFETADALRITVEWEDGEDELSMFRFDDVITHTIGTDFVYVNGEKMQFDVSSEFRGSVLMFPVRLLGDALSHFVDWDTEVQGANIINSIACEVQS